MLPSRKKLRLAGYEYSQPGAYFVTVCTKDRKCILGHVRPTDCVGADAHIGPLMHGEITESNAEIDLSRAGKIVETYIKSIPGIDWYVVMPNHVHMILRISAEKDGDGSTWEDAPIYANISQLMRSWKILVTKELGKSIWQRSFYDHVIRGEKDYIEIVEYIQNNPAKWIEDDYYTKM